MILTWPSVMFHWNECDYWRPRHTVRVRHGGSVSGVDRRPKLCSAPIMTIRGSLLHVGF